MAEPSEVGERDDLRLLAGEPANRAPDAFRGVATDRLGLRALGRRLGLQQRRIVEVELRRRGCRPARSEEHTSELQSRVDLVCRLLLEKKKNSNKTLSFDFKNKTTLR